MTRGATISLATSGLGLLTTLLFAADVASSLRSLLAVAYLLLGPGLVMVNLLGFRQPLPALALAVAVSLGLETVIVTALLVTGTWTPGRALAIIVAITVVAAALEVTGKGGRSLSESDA